MILPSIKGYQRRLCTQGVITRSRKVGSMHQSAVLFTYITTALYKPSVKPIRHFKQVISSKWFLFPKTYNHMATTFPQKRSSFTYKQYIQYPPPIKCYLVSCWLNLSHLSQNSWLMLILKGRMDLRKRVRVEANEIVKSGMWVKMDVSGRPDRAAADT